MRYIKKILRSEKIVFIIKDFNLILGGSFEIQFLAIFYNMPVGGDHSKQRVMQIQVCGSIGKPKQLGRPEFCDLESVRIEVQVGLVSKGGAFASDLGHSKGHG